jgi:putative ABC transport system permease protein
MGLVWFRLLVRMMPGDFRSEFGEEVCRVAEEQWEDARHGLGAWGTLHFWARQSMALARAAPRVRQKKTDTRGGTVMDGFVQDLKYAARGLGRRPGFTTVTVLTLGLGIGATTAIFSAVHAVLLRPLPYGDAERVVVLFRGDVFTGERREGVSAANVRDFRDAATLFQEVAVAEPWSLDLRVEGRAESLRTWSVTQGFFEAIGAEPILGRTFTDADYAEAGSSIVVLGHRAWTNRFGSDPAIVGQPLTLDGQARTVVGVLPADFRFPDAAELWIPRPPQPWDEQSRPADFMTGVARLADGVSLAQAEAEASRIATTLRQTYTRVNADLDYQLVPLREHLLGNVRTPLLVIMAAVGFVLLIACANVAGLILARGAQRERDYALRGALGASAGRLVSHVSAESLLLALAGCIFGVVLTHGGMRAIQALGPDHLPRIDQLSVDGTVLSFALATAVLSAVLSGLAPSLRLSRPDLRGALGDGARGASSSRRQARARGHLVVAQVAAAVVLLFGAGLLIRSFAVLLEQDLGFDPTDRLALQIFAYDYESPAEARVVVDEMIANIEALPGVTGVGMTTDLPGATDGAISKIDITVPFTIQDRDPPPQGQEPVLEISQISPDFFEMMGIDIVAGRAFTAADNADATPVVMVNEALVRRHFPNDDPIGERLLIRFGEASVPREIVGVARDTRPLGHASEPRPEAYTPLLQQPTGSITFVVRASVDAAALTIPAMEAIWEANPAQSIWGAAPVEDMLADWLKERRFNLFLLTTFSVLALALAAIGLYGLVSFSVERRLGELGIRRALGGRAGDLVGMVLGEGARLAAVGLVIGLVAAWYLSRFMQGMLFEIEPTDPLTFALLGLLVLAIALAATLLPAMRAMRVDPVEALRSE